MINTTLDKEKLSPGTVSVSNRPGGGGAVGFITFSAAATWVALLPPRRTGDSRRKGGEC